MAEQPKQGERPDQELPAVDVAERAGHHTGNPQVLESRLFMHLLVFDCSEQLDPAHAIDRVASELAERRSDAVLYEDVHAPRSFGVLTFNQDPAHFVTRVRPAITAAGAGFTLRPGMSMFGRTYATGYEPDLRFWLLERPVATVNNEAWPWAVWYPLRRSGAFNRLEGREQAAILREHGQIGRAYGAQDLVHDIRLACFGLDTHDNDFVIGLIGKDLHPLSHVVQSMRKTRQTGEFMEQMGPFFVGHVARRITSS
jgi:chlorite dismutase